MTKMSKMRTEDVRAMLTGPGDTLLETIEKIGMSQVELAERMGITSSKINDLISGKEPVTVKTAMKLETVLGIDTQFWLNRETLYREKLARIEQEEKILQYEEWTRFQPLKQLREAGYLSKDLLQKSELTKQLLRFYAVVSPDEWQSVYVDDLVSVSFRKSKTFNTSMGSVASFLRVGEIELQDRNLPDFNKQGFAESLTEIKKLAKEHPEDYLDRLQEICERSGVAVIYTINFPGAPISGTIRWIAGHPVIQLTDRHKTNDQFWFTFFHEAGHVLLHGKKDVFIEDFEGVDLNKEKEEEANRFAGNWLLPEKFLADLPASLQERDIIRIARAAEIHPGIVLGRLQGLEILPFSFRSNLKVKVLLNEHLNEKRFKKRG